MFNISKLKSIKKGLSITIAASMMLAMTPAALVKADHTDIHDLVMELNDLGDAKKIIIDGMWTYMVDSINDGVAATEEGAYDKILEILDDAGKADMITEGASTANDGKISDDSLKAFISKMFAQKAVILEQYNNLKGTGLLDMAKIVLGADTEGDVFVKTLSKLEDKNVKLVTMENDKFVKYDPENQGMGVIIAKAYGFPEAALSSLAGALEKVDSYFDEYIEELNDMTDKGEIGKEDVKDILDLYSLYKKPSTSSSGGSGGSGGGGGFYIPPVENETNTPVNTGITTGVAISAALNEVKNIQDPQKALEKAKEIFASAESLLKNTSGMNASDRMEAERELLKIAHEVMAKINSEVIEISDEAGPVTGEISNEMNAYFTSKIQDIVKMAKELQAALNQAGVTEKVEAVLNITLAAPANAISAQLNFSSNLLNAALENKLDKLAIDIGVAKIVAAPDFIRAGAAEAISFSANILDQSSLTDEVWAAAGGNPVYDFSLKVGDRNVAEFEKPVEMSIPYTLKPGEDPHKVTVFYINDKGQLENMAGIYDSETGTVRFTTDHFSGFAPKHNSVTFNDYASAEWARADIEAMASKGIIKGVGSQSFAPSANITRAEFAAIIVRAFKLTDETAVNTFTDVDDSAWYAKEIASAVKSGLVQGVGDGTFAPDSNITRQDMAVMMARALAEVKDKAMPTNISDYTGSFKDKGEISQYAANSVAMAVKYELIKGMTQDTFVPTENATRAQAAAMMNRIINLK